MLPYKYDKEFSKLTENLYNELKLVVTKKDEQAATEFLDRLNRIDDYLDQKGSKFLFGDTICSLDCKLMPCLQHIRVAGKYFANFEIPEELTALWRYMYNMYQLNAFKKSCPADEIIINHYKIQQGLKTEKFQTLTFSTDVPLDESELE